MRNIVATRKRFVCLLVTFLLTAGVPGISYGQGRNKIYWTEVGWGTKTGKIRRAHLDGSYVKDIVTGLKAPRAIALDMLRRKVYWTDESTGKIQRADLTGRNVKDIVTGFKLPPEGGSIHIRCADGECKGVAFPRNGGEIKLSHDLLIDPHCLALDVGRKKIYWGNRMLDRIQRANLDGSNVEDIVTWVFPNALTLDRGRGKIYWTDYSHNKIRRANLDGSNVEDIVTGLNYPNALALDVARGKIYWTAQDRALGSGTIRRANLDGSNVEDIVTILNDLTSLALDSGGGKIYWIASDPGTNMGKIQRANLNGSRVKDIITGLSHLWSIALDIPGTYVAPGVDKLTTTWGEVKSR